MNNPFRDVATQSLDTTLATIGGKATYAGGTTTVASWLLSSEGGILIGILIGVCGFIMQAIYSRRRDKREQAEHERRMANYDAQKATTVAVSSGVAERNATNG